MAIIRQPLEDLMAKTGSYYDMSEIDKRRKEMMGGPGKSLTQSQRRRNIDRMGYDYQGGGYKSPRGYRLSGIKVGKLGEYS